MRLKKKIARTIPYQRYGIIFAQVLRKTVQQLLGLTAHIMQNQPAWELLRCYISRYNEFYWNIFARYIDLAEVVGACYLLRDLYKLVLRESRARVCPKN